MNGWTPRRRVGAVRALSRRPDGVPDGRQWMPQQYRHRRPRRVMLYRFPRLLSPCASDAQNMIAGIDKLHRTCDPAGEITAQVQRRLSDLFDGDIAAQWRP